MTQSNIAHAINVSFRASGFKDNVSSTMIRKFAVSHVHRNAPALKQQLSLSMMHSQATAVKHYLLQDRQQNTRRVSRYLRLSTDKAPTETNSQEHPIVLLHEAGSASRPTEEQDLATPDDVEQAGEEIEAEAHAANPASTHLRPNPAPTTTAANPAPTHAESLSASNLPTRKERKRVFSSEDDEALQIIFRDIILRRSISMKDVKARMKTQTRMLKHLEEKLHDKGSSLFIRIYEKVRNLMKARARQKTQKDNTGGQNASNDESE